MWTVPRFATPIVLVVLGCQHPMPAREQSTPRETAVHAPFLQDTVLGVVHYSKGRGFDLRNAATRDSLRILVNRERAQWKAVAPRQHQYLLQTQCFCPGQRGWLLVQVQDGNVAGAWSGDGKRLAPGDRDVFNIDELFKSLLSMANSDRMLVNVAFDPRLHFPAYVGTSMAGLPDAWSITEIRAFRSTP